MFKVAIGRGLHSKDNKELPRHGGGLKVIVPASIPQSRASSWMSLQFYIEHV
jgi:hypothetical protein